VRAPELSDRAPPPAADVTTPTRADDAVDRWPKPAVASRGSLASPGGTKSAGNEEAAADPPPDTPAATPTNHPPAPRAKPPAPKEDQPSPSPAPERASSSHSRRSRGGSRRKRRDVSPTVPASPPADAAVTPPAPTPPEKKTNDGDGGKERPGPAGPHHAGSDSDDAIDHPATPEAVLVAKADVAIVDGKSSAPSSPVKVVDVSVSTTVSAPTPAGDDVSRDDPSTIATVDESTTREEDEEDEEEEEEDSDYVASDDDSIEPRSKKAKTTSTPPISLSMEAVMDRNVVPPTTTPSVDEEIRERIRNILHRGLHPNTPEAEAANSMRVAERMLRKHNVSRADIMETADDASVNGDMVKVHIRNPQTKKPSTTKNWFHDLARAMTYHFKCKYLFSVRLGERCYFSFYGIASNVYAAAFAFETAFNRIMNLVSQHTIPSGEYERKHRAREISVCRATYTKMARVSYCDGLAMGLLQRVREMTATPPSTKDQEATEYDVTPEEETRLACVTNKVEKSVLDKNNIKISKGRGRTYTRVQRRSESYLAGKRDSEHIDLQQRTLA
jgi:hypothetical protein